ncbi:hypothetical protein BOW53_00300 [Solemya pervernicosa gill symbiont]|uniref:Outer membrane protein beta-barrel domain-containing protein n=2 Tax=Gammaproteobacteria incertae sedis TaxID=118884 RepID=A0A1T2LB39_9GAMM|nr:outer membrane beta-barrel protein [Candidatus Reidiella endopervernicosa]OOZ42319.1 hypothetical protein BOW53_00300 [Solemya pervernicosa gill symbiont]QKQ25715.1 porin family protein [Candidatus Reidiella endopervernicosa]
MNKKLISTAVVAASMFVGAAQASENGYLAIGGGINVPTDAEVSTLGDQEMDNGYLFSVAIGQEVEDGFRIEGEYAYRAADVDEAGPGVDVSVQAGMLNGIFDMDTGSEVTPYIGAGIGAANMNWDGSVDDNETVFAYQVMLGLNVEMSPESSLRFGYRYFDPAEASINPYEIDSAFHDFEIGLRFNF